MNDSHNISADDIALIRMAGDRTRSNASERSASGESGGTGRASRTPRRTRNGTTTPPSQGKRDRKKKSEDKGNVDPDERFRQVLALLLGLGGLLLFLALVSYSRFDQANTDIQPTELVGLLTNDPDIAARADTTENWLGLLGAFFSNFFLNGTIGWFALTVPVLLGYWSFVIFSGRNIARATRTTLFTLLIGMLGAALFGTMRSISWMPAIAYEWSGAVGTFIATLLGSLIGAIGATLMLLAGITIAIVYALDMDIRRLAALVGTHGTRVAGGVAGAGAKLKEVMAAERAPKSADESDASSDSDAMPVVPQKHDNEPARMTRRIKAADRGDVPEPSINRPTFARREAQTPPSPVAGERPPTGSKEGFSESNGTSQGAGGTDLRPDRGNLREPERTGPVVAAAAATGRIGPERVPPVPNGEPGQAGDIDAVTLTREPHEEPSLFQTGMLAGAAIIDAHAAEGPKLTVHVEDAETDADLEMEMAGKLIDRLRDEQIKYDPPPIDLLTSQEAHSEVDDTELKTHARLLQEKLRTFNIEIENLTVTPGPVVTLFEFVPAAGIKLSQIESLGDDIALALKARGIRIIAPIPGKGTVGVEIPNNNPAMVRIRSVLNTTKFREAEMHLPLALGKTTVGEVYCADLTKMPHLLIAGATGSGKSVGVNSILTSLIYKMHPSDLKLAIIDPKKIELTQYRSLIDHFLVSCPDIDEDIVTDPQNAVLLLKSLEMEMDRRYDMLAKSGQRNIFDYNKKIEEGVLKPTPQAPHVKLPYIVLIIDELADLMITASKEVEEPIARLAQLARAIGIHIIVATQRPSVDVLTGMIKANFPARIAYQVATKIDSRTILDMNGAEQLLGNGDMLYLPGGRPKPLRLQNAFISTDEVEAICEHIGSQTGYSQPYLLPSVADKKKQGASGTSDERDELFDEAARLVVRHQQGSVSLIQRRLKVGYARAARIVDELEDAGIVGSFDGSKARAVLLESEAELEAFL